MPGSAAIQSVVAELAQGRIICVDSAYDVDARNSNRDVTVTASYSGVLCARFVAKHRPRGIVGVDCGIGLDGAGIAGLWYYEALNLRAVTVDVMTVELGNGLDVYAHGTISRVNTPAQRSGVRVGMTANEAARLMLVASDVIPAEPSDVTNRTVVWQDANRAIICTDSIASALPDDTDRNVLCTGGHTGRSAVPYLRSSRPWGFICSDGGRGRNDSGTTALGVVEADGLAGATVDAKTARMGDGLRTYREGVISVANGPALERGVRIGMPASDAAMLLIDEAGWSAERQVDSVVRE
jgi:hypothetical protein